MAVMEFLKANQLNTTTSIAAQAANTGTVAYLFDRNTGLGFTSVGYDSTTAAVLTVTFSTPTVLTNIMLQNHNLKQFRLFYDGVTANSLANFTTNSDSSTYLNFSSVTVSSVTLQMDLGTTVSTEKSVGELVFTERQVAFERNPSHNDFEPVTQRTRVIHKMPDGGVTMYSVANKFKARLRWKFVSTTFRASLLSVYNTAMSIYYVPFPTTSGWDGFAYEVLWTNDFNFTHSDNSKSQGFEGEIEIMQTPSS